MSVSPQQERLPGEQIIDEKKERVFFFFFFFFFFFSWVFLVLVFGVLFVRFLFVVCVEAMKGLSIGGTLRSTKCERKKKKEKKKKRKRKREKNDETVSKVLCFVICNFGCVGNGRKSISLFLKVF